MSIHVDSIANLKDAFPFAVAIVINNNRCFAYGDDAKVINTYLGYSVFNEQRPTVSFPNGLVLMKVISVLERQKVSYIIVENYQIIKAFVYSAKQGGNI